MKVPRFEMPLKGGAPSLVTRDRAAPPGAQRRGTSIWSLKLDAVALEEAPRELRLAPAIQRSHIVSSDAVRRLSNSKRRSSRTPATA